jgi:signal transduction histidine kinase
VEGDRVRLEQALSNLVENALRHGGGAIRLAAREHRDLVELHVQDEGAGFPPGFAEEAFQRFTRGQGARDGAGAGLGLAIVQAIAAAHGGRAAAGAGPGADVWVTLPSRAPAAVRAEARP